MASGPDNHGRHDARLVVCKPMNQTEQILSQLRDVQLPPAPEGAPVWLMMANLIMLLLVLTGLGYRRYRRRNQWRRDTLFRVQQARSEKPAVALLTLAKLLRQILIHRHHDIPGNAQSWLHTLDEAFGTDWFTQAEGRLFGDALYQPQQPSEEELQAVCSRLEQLIRKLPTRVPRTPEHTSAGTLP